MVNSVNKGGRPTLEQARRRGVFVRMREVDYEIVRKAAEAHGVSLADWARTVLLKASR